MARGILFSEDFLVEGITLTEEYRSLDEVAVSQLYERIEAIYINFTGHDEADTEDDLITPVLSELGFLYRRQKTPDREGQRNIPDFVLFSSKEDRDCFDQDPRSPSSWMRIKAIVEGKRLGIPLDRGGKTDPLDRGVPSGQIMHYMTLVAAKTQNRVVWGILTNGKEWRLYYFLSNSGVDGYVEFSFEEIFGNTPRVMSPTTGTNLLQPEELFKRFLVLFRRDAFIPGVAGSFLERIYNHGKEWEKKVADNIKEIIFNEVFSEIASGFIEYTNNKGISTETNMLDSVYANTLVLLYRLLFLFHAEDRNLLPIEYSDYSEYSAKGIRKRAKDKVDNHRALLDNSYEFWGSLLRLFHIIDQGEPALGLSPYDGGLFNPLEHPFLEENKVADNYLVPAIDKLSREYSASGKKWVNYRDLSVRQLGSLYEGLLEFRLRIADQNLSVKKKNKKETYEPCGPNDTPVVFEGELFLTNDNLARKSSGSYYTPDAIVKWIVEKTLKPRVDWAFDKFEDCKTRLTSMTEDEVVSELSRIEIFGNSEFEGVRVSLDAMKTYLLSMEDPVQAIIETKVLDPAMGSAHFLATTVDYLTFQALRALANYSGVSHFGNIMYESPVTARIEKNREDILIHAKENGYIVDEDKLDDANLLKRIALKNCVYGVDLNPLAVELAKLTLWLNGFTIGAPLSFLNHHLKHGNSIIGTGIINVEDSLRFSLVEASSTGMESAARLLSEVSHLADTSFEELEKSQEEYRTALDTLRPYVKTLDLWESEQFGNVGAADLIRNRLITPDNFTPDSLPSDKRIILKKAEKIARERAFFHWDVEFPEVFYGKEGLLANPGFDAVIGNPPWVSFGLRAVGTLEEIEGSYYRNRFPGSAQYKLSTYSIFIERAISLTKATGRHGFVVPDSFLLGQYFSKLRGTILSTCRIKELCLITEDFWPEGSVGWSVVYDVVTEPAENARKQNMMAVEKSETYTDFKNRKYSTHYYSQDTFFNEKNRFRFRLFFSENDKTNVEHMESVSIELGRLVEFKSGLIGRRGKSSIVLESRPADFNTSIYGKLIESGNYLEPFNATFNGKYIKKDKALYKSGYFPEHYERHKILLNQTGDSLKACYDEEGYYCLNNIHFGVPADGHNGYALLFISALLSSGIMNWYYQTISLEKGRPNAQIDIETVHTLPIKVISFTTAPGERERLFEEARSLHSECITTRDFSTLSKFVDERLKQIHATDERLVRAHNGRYINRRFQVVPGSPWEQSDVIHDLLSCIALEIGKLKRYRQEEVSSFLDYLENLLSGGSGRVIDQMSNKTKIQRYYEKDFNVFWGVLLKNKKLISGFDPTKRIIRDTVKEEFEKSVRKIETIRHYINANGDFVDEVVVKLYGLEQ